MHRTFPTYLSFMEIATATELFRVLIMTTSIEDLDQGASAEGLSQEADYNLMNDLLNPYPTEVDPNKDEHRNLIPELFGDEYRRSNSPGRSRG